MTQTEQMLRLLKIDKSSPSGFRIAGFEYHCPINSFGEATQAVYHATDINITENLVNLLECCNSIAGEYDNTIIYDAFELGIKVGDEWLFEGDRITKKGCGKGVLACDQGCIGILWDDEQKYDGVIPSPLSLHNLDELKRIGDIHEETTK